jgi:hypothetical protein
MTFARFTRVTVRALMVHSEYSFMGTVRVEHTQAGMGIEFDGRDRDHATRVNKLIQDLSASEDLAPQVQVDPQSGSDSVPQTVDSTLAPKHDNLLALILVGAALKREDFLRELERQRRSKH